MPLNSKQASFVGNLKWPDNPYSKTYNPIRKNHSTSLGQISKGLLPDHKVYLKPKRMPHLKIYLCHTSKGMTYPTNHLTFIKNLEIQIGQVVTMLQKQNMSALPCNTTTNTKEHANAITLRSEREVGLPKRGEAKPPIS